MSNADAELESAIGGLLGLLTGLIKGLFRGIRFGAKRLNTWKKLLLFLCTFTVPAVVYLNRELLQGKLERAGAPAYISVLVVGMLLLFPLWVLVMLGQGNSGNAYQEAFKEIAFKGKDNRYPVFCGKARDGKKVMLTFKSSISLTEWQAARDRLETGLDCNILKIENGSNKRVVRLTTLPSDFTIPSMIEWSEGHLSQRSGELAVGQSALDTIRFNLNRVPHVLVAGETGSGKSVILRCLLWQMIEQGARVYMIDFKGGVEFGRQYEQFGEVITERDRALEVFTFLVTENEARLKLFRELEVKNLDEYNKKTHQHLCRIGVFTDELAEMLDKKGVSREEKAVFEQLEGKLSTLARLSRATGINLFMGVQRPDANVLTGQIKNNIPVRISGRFADKTASEIVLGNTDAVHLPDIKGRFLYKVGNETIEFQSFYFDDERMLHDVDVEPGDMLTDKTEYRFRTGGKTAEAPDAASQEMKSREGRSSGKKARRGRKGGFGEPAGTWKPAQSGKAQDPSSWEKPLTFPETIREKALEAEMRRMDEEDLKLDFGDFGNGDA